MPTPFKETVHSILVHAAGDVDSSIDALRYETIERDTYHDNLMFEAGRLAIFDASYNTRRAYETLMLAAEFTDELYARALNYQRTN